MKFNWILFLCITPYVTAMSYDLWMHIHHRKVPTKEQFAHGFAILFLGIFIFSAIMNLNTIAVVALCCAIPVMLYDEIAFHKMLSKYERKIHNIAGICFLTFIAVWVLSLTKILNVV